MSTFIALVKFTQKGIEGTKHLPDRVAKAKEAIKAAGGEMTAWYMTLGQYDAVIIVNAPDDKTYATTMLAIGSLGNISTETLKGFAIDEVRQIVSALP